MREKNNFTTCEEEELRRARKMGGIFLKLADDPSVAVEVLGKDGNDGWRRMKVLGKEITQKIHNLYNNQNGYKAPVTDGCRLVSIAWFIEEYC